MNDLIVLILTVVFFGVAVAYVGLCDRIIGPDPEPADGDADAPEVEVEAVTA
ncbi:hypothetical protein [Dermatobacter hominis]|uniref:hypothetical protein n=1 Tax=Dermatobacter hominis TaxID=2884263 RepID=UPI001D12F09E|nr:hypothetical protein [Dermatobacter hominis]UDY34557.1 hypothetical protein LH044_14585 [Dermatobacter hominis]